MSHSLPSLNGLRAFEAAARTGSYVAAAAELRVSASAISRLVKLLEHRLGVSFFERLPNGLVLSDVGARYLQEVTAGFEQISSATQRLRESQSVSLLIGAGPTLAMRWLIPRLHRFHAVHPEIDVRLSTAVAEAEPIRAEWTAGIRMGTGRWPLLQSDFLFTADLFPVCTPAMAKSLKSLSDLKSHAVLQAMSAPEDWQHWLKVARAPKLDLSRAQQFDYPAFALQAAIDGLGVAMARAPFVADDLAAGRLVRPFKLAVPKGKGWHLIYRPALKASPALVAFRDWLLAEAQSSNTQPERMVRTAPSCSKR